MNIEYKEEYIKNMSYLALAAFCFLVFAFLTSGVIVRFLKAQDDEKKAMRFCMIFGNAAFLGYPLCYALFGQIGMFYASIYVVVQNFVLWTLGVNIFQKGKFHLSNLKRLINPGTVAISIGLIMFFFGIEPPGIISKVMKGIGNITIPLALMTTGATLYGHRFIEIAADRKAQLTAFIKLLIFPVIFLSILYFIPMDKMLKSILTIQAAGPIQASAAAYTKNFKGNPVIPAKAIFISTMLCLITIPLFLVLINLS